MSCRRIIKVMVVMNYKIIFLSIILFASVSFAFDPVIKNCRETPELYDIEGKPDEFIKSNNLRRKVGSPMLAEGKLIYIVGRVTDIDCLPIKNAAIFMWQTNNYGHYQSLAQKNQKQDLNFSGSGMSITDNLGNYSFITIMPKRYENRMPHLNFIIQHPDFLELTTLMFFPGNDNFKDSKLKTNVHKDLLGMLIPFHYKNDDNLDIYKFDITLGNKSVYEIK